MHLKTYLAKMTCAVGDAMRPVLTRILPMKTLKFIKSRLIEGNAKAQQQRQPFLAGKYPVGVNLIGYIRAEMGLGQGCRLMAAALEQSALPYTILKIKVPGGVSNLESGFEERIGKAARYGVNLIHINAEQMPLLQLNLPMETWDYRYNIGIWLWELEDFPDEWVPQFAAVDEIWTPSTFNSASIAAKSPVPVVTIPYGIEAPVEAAFDRAHFGLPEGKFLFLCMYDVNSTARRKNPLGAIEAFRLAFLPEQTDVGLVIKVNNPNEAELAALRAACGAYERSVYIIGAAQPMTKVEVNSLIAATDSFISLHRSEGFGLVIAEAMLLGKPCVATAWSANMDFMDESCACPVDYTLVPIGEDCGPYKAYQRWAQPDIRNAAAYLQRLVDDKAYYAAISKQARQRISQDFSPASSAAKMRERLRALGML